MNNYLIPANSKKGLLIFGVFTLTDLIIFLIGVGSTFGLLLIFPPENIVQTGLDLTPALLAGLLVSPIKYYHNALTILLAIFEFITRNQKLVWKGWEYEKVYGGETKKI